jgi:SAM-dependent methyltransferase
MSPAVDRAKEARPDGEPAAHGDLRFNDQRPADVHRPSWGHRYRHYTVALHDRLQELSAALGVQSGSTILDYGSAEEPYRHFFPEDIEYLGADLPGNPRAALEIARDGTLPVADGRFDAVLSTQVLEHVRDPALYLSECHRVLRPGGRLMASTHGMFVYHPDPDDYWRWTSAGLQAAIRDAGFTVERFEGVLGLLPTAIQLAQDSIYWRLPPPLRPLLAGVMQSVIAFTDGFYGEESKRLNASVFVLVAEKPMREAESPAA